WVLKHYNLSPLSILEARGYVLEAGDTLIMPIVHPSYIAQGNPEFWEITVYDLKRASDLQHSWKGYKQEHFDLSPSLEKIEATCDWLVSQGREFAIDLETYPNNVPLEKLCIRSMAIAWSPEEAMCIPLTRQGGVSWWSEDYEVRVWSAIAKLLEAGNCRKITQNGSAFDLPILRYHGFRVGGRHDDTLTMHLLAYLELPHSLEFIASCFSRRRPFKRMLKGKGGLLWAKPEEVHLYNCRDACATFEIEQVLREELASHGCLKMYEEVYVPLQECVTDMQVAGVQVDVNLARELRAKADEALSLERRQWSEALGYELNPASPQQVREMLEKDLALGIGESADKLHLLKLGVKNPEAMPIIKGLLLYRDLVKVRGTYLDVETDPQGRLHSQFAVRTITLRLSSKAPDLQNLPREPMAGINVRDIYIAKPGCLLLSRDYSQLEYRIPAYASRCEKLIKMFEAGENVHMRNACVAFRREITSKNSPEYAFAKRLKYAEGYGGGPERISDEMLKDTYELVDPEFIRSILERWREEYPEYYQWHEEGYLMARDKGYLVDGFGFRRDMFLPKDERRNQGYAWPTATTASQIMNRAMVRYWNSEYRHDLNIQLVMQVHDELVFEVPERHIREADKLIKADMEVPVEIFGVGPVVFPTEGKFGVRYSEMKPL
ncbi:MAG: DNA polymerase, partial [Nitrososphaerota archaeon]